MHEPGPNPLGLPLPACSRRAALAALGAAALAGCGPVRPPRVALGGGARTRLTPTAPRIDAVPGRMLVTPVRVEGPIAGDARPRVRLADGRELEGRLVWLGVEPDAVAWSSWLPAFERWVVVPAGEGAIPASLGAWRLVASLPADAGGQAIELDGRTVPVNWLPDPDSLSPRVDGGTVWAPWRAQPTGPGPDAELLAPAWRSPLRLWHARLVTTGLGGGSGPGIWQVRGDADVVDALAELTEARWRVGLARLYYADEGACLRLLDTLSRTAEIEPGLHAPAWPVDQDSLDALLHDLLAPGLAGEALAARAERWTDAVPDAAVWVEDDASALVGPRSEPLVRIRAVALTPTSGLAWTTGRADLRVGEPKPLELARPVEMILPAGQGKEVTGGRSFTVRAGDATRTVAARELIPARPPGVNCGPLLADWTLAAWIASDPALGAAPDPAHAAAVLLYRDQAPGGSGWAAYIECSSPEPGEDVVTLWLGGRGRASAAIHVGRDGAVRTERPESPASESAEGLATVVRDGPRWSASVPIPEQAIEPGGVVRIGITRRDPRALRTAWPRRMMPWDHEPARAAIDLTAWSGLAGS